ncbi:MAG: Hpt domain-containing protein [Burkholderiales bacterium]|nr:Hpt domain-containing protein [Burkholderiales bacterium]
MPTLPPRPPSAPADAAGGAGAARGPDDDRAAAAARGPDGGRTAAAGSGEAALDAPTLARLRQLDPGDERGFVQRVLQAYARSLERHLQALAEAAAAGDLAAAGEQAHALKSSSASVGALALAAACADLERRARAGDAEVLGAPLRALADEGARVRDAVQAMLRG